MDFKPAKAVRDRTGYKAAYEHMTDRIEVKINHRDEDGAVISAPRNITTKPPKSGRVGPGTSFGGIAKHMADNYENARVIAQRELKEH